MSDVNNFTAAQPPGQEPLAAPQPPSAPPPWSAGKPPEEPKRKKSLFGKYAGYAITGLVALLLGLAVGAGTGHSQGFADGQAQVRSTPAPTVTQTQVQTVDRTPAACTEALDQADTAILDSGEAIQHLVDGAKEAMAQEYSLGTSDVQAANDSITKESSATQLYKTYRDTCKGQ